MEVAAWLPQQVLRQHSHRPEHQIRWLVDDLQVMLVSTLEGFPIDLAAYFADVADLDVAGSVPLAEPGVMYDVPTRQVRLLAAPAEWAGRLLAEGAIIWKNTDDPFRSPLVGIVDFGGPRMSVDGRFRIDWHPDLGALAYQVVVPAQFGRAA